MSSPAQVKKVIKVRRRHPLIGSEVRGVDLAKPLDDATFAELHALWMEHLVLIFPEQPIAD
jgi:alpha-ketoglutarate-dependent taurine dioxygenase